MSAAIDFSVKSTLEAFEVVVKHLLSQKQRATGLNGDCAYRGFDDMTEYPEDIDEAGDIDEVWVPNGLLCAVGALIKDQFYDPQIEGNDVLDDGVQQCIKDSHPGWNLSLYNIDFLSMLQNVHDKHDVNDWASFFMYMIDNYISIVNGDLSWNFDGHYEMLLAEYKNDGQADRLPDVTDDDVFAAIENLKARV